MAPQYRPYQYNMDSRQYNMDSRELRRQSTAQNRKARFLAAQAALPEHERLDAVRDWNVMVWRQLSEGRESAIASIKQAFLDFLTDEDLPIKLSHGAAAEFFIKDGPVVTTQILRMFVEFMSQSRKGLIPQANGKLNQDTVHAYVQILGVALKRARNPLEPEVKEAAHAWIDGYLLPRGMVSTIKKEKKTCFDISTLVQTILSPEYMATMADTRAPLQLILFLTLAIDCSGRVGEFLATYGKKKKPTYLRWRHATITAFRTPAGVTLRGTLRFENLKDAKGKEGTTKIIPLRLLPLELAAEDSFRTLLVLGFIDQVFDGLRSWEDIQRLNPGPEGTHVLFKQSALDLPIFRLVQCHRVTESPLKYYTVHNELHRLSRYMGLEHRLMCGAIRRGAAYLLAMNCTEEERCARMGHKKGDGIYWNHYRNETSTVDFQAIVHNAEAEDVTSLSSITINRRPDAPKRPSHAAYREMWQLPHVAELRDTKLTLFDKILCTYGSMKKARAVQARELEDYDRAVSKYQILCRSSIEAIFKRELAELFASDCPLVVEPPQVASSSTQDDESLLIHALEASEEGEDASASPTTASASSNALIDPVLLNPLIDPVLLLSETSSNLAKVFEDASADSQDHPSEILARESQHRTGKTVIRPVTLVDSVSDELLNGTVLSDWELADLMIKSFNHMFPPDHFEPGQEPIPGSRNCRFCGSDLTTLADRGAPKHAHYCQKKALAIDIVNRMNTECPQADKCTWVGKRTSKECGKMAIEFADTEKWARHLSCHIYPRRNPMIRCRFGKCAEETVQFKGLDALKRHTIVKHGLNVSRAESARTTDLLIWWCPICFRHINQLDEDIDDHARSHILIINDIIHADGYTGLTICELAVIPVFCIFCVHDASKTESVRFHCWLALTNLAIHIYQHVERAGDTAVHCPASIATRDGISCNCSAEPMEPANLRLHLLSVHGVETQLPMKTHKKPSDTDEESDQPRPKKGNTRGSRRILQTKTTNIVRQAARQGNNCP